jgi:hypothetical protein
MAIFVQVIYNCSDFGSSYFVLVSLMRGLRENLKHKIRTQVDNKAVEEKSGNDLGDTLFILDLMRQRKEKLMRQKKDEKINEMAMKQKQQKLEARQGMRVLTRPSFGGFVGKVF